MHACSHGVVQEKFTSKEYRDATDTTGVPTGSSYPVRDEDGNPLETEFGLCVYKDHQVRVKSGFVQGIGGVGWAVERVIG